MGTSKLEYYNGRLKGSLSDTDCDRLEEMLSLKAQIEERSKFRDSNDDEESYGISALKNVIYDLDDDMVDRIIEEFNTEGYIALDLNIEEEDKGVLRDYQTVAVGFLYFAQSCILGDSVGMGKTVEISGLLNLLDVESQKNTGKPCRYLFCTEKKLVTQVHRELIKFTGKFVYPINDAMQGTLKQFKNAIKVENDLPCSIVGTHHLIKSAEFIEWLGQYVGVHGESPFDVIIIDESSVLGGSKSKIHDAFKTLRQYFKRAYFLNATPMETGLDVLYNQLNLLDGKYMPTKTMFQREYVQMDFSGFYPRPTGKYKNVEKFRNLVGYKYFANTRKDNGAIMENCKGRIVLSEMTPRQKELMKESQLMQMIFDCPSYIDDNIDFNEVNVPKLKALKDLLEGECKDYKSIIIYVHFREAQRAIHEWCDKMGYTNRVLNGDTSHVDSDEIISGFKNGEYRILITNVQKGLNFNCCNCCIFYSIISNPSTMVQFEGRMTRGFDIYDKAVYIVCSTGYEYKTLCSTVKDRVEAMEAVTNVDYSIVLRLLKDAQEVQINEKEKGV